MPAACDESFGFVQPLSYYRRIVASGTPVSPAVQENLVTVTTLASTDGQTLGTAHSGFA